jgi:hypothetical protein
MRRVTVAVKKQQRYEAYRLVQSTDDRYRGIETTYQKCVLVMDNKLSSFAKLIVLSTHTLDWAVSLNANKQFQCIRLYPEAMRNSAAHPSRRNQNNVQS